MIFPYPVIFFISRKDFPSRFSNSFVFPFQKIRSPSADLRRTMSISSALQDLFPRDSSLSSPWALSSVQLLPRRPENAPSFSSSPFFALPLLGALSLPLKTHSSRSFPFSHPPQYSLQLFSPFSAIYPSVLHYTEIPLALPPFPFRLRALPLFDLFFPDALNPSLYSFANSLEPPPVIRGGQRTAYVPPPSLFGDRPSINALPLFISSEVRQFLSSFTFFRSTLLLALVRPFPSRIQDLINFSAKYCSPPMTSSV